MSDRNKVANIFGLSFGSIWTSSPFFFKKSLKFLLNLWTSYWLNIHHTMSLAAHTYMKFVSVMCSQSAWHCVLDDLYVSALRFVDLTYSGGWSTVVTQAAVYKIGSILGYIRFVWLRWKPWFLQRAVFKHISHGIIQLQSESNKYT